MVESPAIDRSWLAAATRPAVLGFDAQALSETRAIELNTALSCALVLAAIAAGYGLPGSPSNVFITVVPLFVQQIFASTHHARWLGFVAAARSAEHGLPPPRIPGAFIDGAARAVRQSYLLLFLAFDTAWLLHAYAMPGPASSFHEYLARLAMGPLPGIGLVIFTIVFWIVYVALFVYGGFVGNGDSATIAFRPTSALPAETGIERVALSVQVTTREGDRFRVNGYRLARENAQALILWPGFFQNGGVYDLFVEAGTLAEYLHAHGYDLWVFHPRGTGGSDGCQRRASLDDHAAADVPAIISFVAAKVDAPPILVGHSQGGITAILSLMGLELARDGAASLSKSAAAARQSALAGLVTLGAFPSFHTEHDMNLQRFVKLGIPVALAGRVVRIPLPPLIRLVRAVPFVGVPVSVRVRQALLESVLLRALLFPVFLVLEIVGRLAFWEFLYHIPNVTVAARRRLFFLTIEGTFTDVLKQFHDAVYHGTMRSFDGRIDYSEHYGRLRLPVSFMAMELDGFVDEPSMVRLMFERVSSQVKYVTHVPGIGHEDYFMNDRYFSHILAGIEKLRVSTDVVTPSRTQETRGER